MSKNNGKTAEELLYEALVPVEEQPYKVPENWVWIKLGALVKESKLGLVRSSSEQSDVYDHCYIKMNNITLNGNLDLSNLVKINASNIELKQFQLEYGDLLFNTRNSIELVGKSAVYNQTHSETVLFNNNILRIRFKIINSFLINQYLHSPEGKRDLNKIKSSTTNVAAIYAKNLFSLPVPVPPLDEQKRITDKVERLLNKINQTKQLIEEAKETFELRRAAILNKAFRGELTAKWREEQPNTKSAKEWLIKNEIHYNDVDADKVPFNIPDSWTWVRFGELASFQNGLSKRRGTEGESYVVLRLADIKDNMFIETNLRKIVLTENEINKYKVSCGDLLIIRVNGSFDSVGKAVKYDLPFNSTFCDHLIKVSPLFELDTKYLWYIFESAIVRNQMKSKIVSSAGQNTISQGSLTEIYLPIPPKDELKYMVSLLGQILKIEDNLQSLFEKFDDIDDLTQGILQKAFLGELGTNDSKEESSINIILNEIS